MDGEGQFLTWLQSYVNTEFSSDSRHLDITISVVSELMVLLVTEDEDPP